MSGPESSACPGCGGDHPHPLAEMVAMFEAFLEVGAVEEEEVPHWLRGVKWLTARRVARKRKKKKIAVCRRCRVPIRSNKWLNYAWCPGCEQALDTRQVVWWWTTKKWRRPAEKQ